MISSTLVLIPSESFILSISSRHWMRLQTQYSSHRNHECLWLWSFIKHPNSWKGNLFGRIPQFKTTKIGWAWWILFHQPLTFHYKIPAIFGRIPLLSLPGKYEKKSQPFFSIFHTLDPGFPPWRAVATSMTFKQERSNSKSFKQFNLSTRNLKLTWHSCWWLKKIRRENQLRLVVENP